MRIPGAIISLKITFNETQSHKPQANEDEEVIPRKEKINQGRTFSADGGCSEGVWQVT